METIVTTANVKHGMKVVRGPAWRWNTQDEGSVFGVIVKLRRTAGIPGNIRVVWVNEDEYATYEDSYSIPGPGADWEEATFLEYQENRLQSRLEEEGELIANLTNDTQQTWNNAIELCIDLISDANVDDYTVIDNIVDKLYSYRKDVGVLQKTS